MTIGSVYTIMRRDRNGALYWKGDKTDWLDILHRIGKRLATLAHIPIQADSQLPDLLVAQPTSRIEVMVLVITPMLAYAHTAGGTCCIQSYKILYEEGIE
ncbi:hypothetical protein PC129_g5601 [Phytophthora cactorum]|uniref:Uncharacterized protein n=2 Tax=Phytophthora cactorum TaxID=29920 RepID=A0A8T1G325_9STRA|nr:hypothetical protein PC117_g11286 [Phytophthora cactorum]KAG2984670.1 hypothetical protein PC118_g8739 [Phytophthora cactorum]KAG3087243.1 hypothetical protein PC122_g8920 [Phytophthora cactorum]KAG3223756.1 hypothetical protein PC129_g5601 [Phytophthora cactorum]